MCEDFELADSDCDTLVVWLLVVFVWLLVLRLLVEGEDVEYELRLELQRLLSVLVLDELDAVDAEDDSLLDELLSVTLLDEHDVDVLELELSSSIQITHTLPLWNGNAELFVLNLKMVGLPAVPPAVSINCISHSISSSRVMAYASAPAAMTVSVSRSLGNVPMSKIITRRESRLAGCPSPKVYDLGMRRSPADLSATKKARID